MILTENTFYLAIVILQAIGAEESDCHDISLLKNSNNKGLLVKSIIEKVPKIKNCQRIKDLIYRMLTDTSLISQELLNLKFKTQDD